MLDGLHEYLGDDVQIRYSEGCHLYADKLNGLAQEGELISEVKGVCAESDVVICCLGLDSGLEGEGRRPGQPVRQRRQANLNLPATRKRSCASALTAASRSSWLCSAAARWRSTPPKTKPPPCCRPGTPGAMGGLAVARALFGEVNPQGKLPVTFYHSDADLPSFTDYAMKGRTYRYIETEAPLPVRLRPLLHPLHLQTMRP